MFIYLMPKTDGSDLLETSVDESFQDKVLAAEKRITGVRLLVVVSGFVLFPFYAGEPGVIAPLAWTILALALAYSVYAKVAEPYRRFPLLLSTGIMSTSDAAFTMAWLYATGGYGSPFYVAMYMAIIGVAFRYRARETLLAAGIYAVAYVGLVVALNDVPAFWPELLVRVTYLFLCAALGAAVAKEVFAQSVAQAEARRLLKEVERADARLRDAQRISNVGSFDWDVRTQQMQWSDELYRIFGVDEAFHPTFEEFLGRVHPDDRGRVLRTIQRSLEDGTGYDLEERIVWPDGSIRHLKSRGQVALGSDGHPTRLSGVCFDITGQREMEEERLRTRVQAAELERLKQIAQFKSDFINTAAHELSTPLTPIKLQVHMLRSRRSLLGTDEAKSLEILDRNIDRLHKLVEDMLDAARLQASKLGVRRQPTDLHRLVQDTVETFQPMARQANVTLSAQGSGDGMVLADPKRIGQVLTNLVHNAIKFTPPGGTVVVELTSSLGGLTVNVRDSGAGLAPNQMDRLFQPFSQVHSPTRTGAPGTGLGLFICRGILELHEGKIWVVSDGPGRGSTFSFQLPALDLAEAPKLAVATR